MTTNHLKLYHSFSSPNSRMGMSAVGATQTYRKVYHLVAM